MKKTKKLLMLLLALVLVFSLAACGGGTTAPVEEPEESEEPSESEQEGEEEQEAEEEVRTDLNMVVQAEPVGFNPLKTNDSASSRVNVQIYETLFVRSFDGQSYEPLLAESYTNPDDTTWVIKLKEGITFHDGTPFNAEAVKYSFERIMDPEYGSARASLMATVESVNALSEYEVEIKTKAPDGVMLAKLAHANGAIASPTAEQNQDLMAQPVGTGPYKFVEFESGSHVILEANEDYWNGAPFIKNVRIDIVPEISTAISKLETGESDWFEGITAEHLSRVQNMSGVKLVSELSGRVTYLGVRANSSKTGSTEIPEVREAISYALDKQGFVATQNGLAVPSDSLVGPKVFGYTEDSESYGTGFDMEMAKQIVEENNLSDKPIHILASNSSFYPEIAEWVQASLLEAGFEEVEIEMMEWGAFLSETTQENRMDIFPLGWSNLTGDGSELFYPNWHSDNIGGGNRSYYQNPEFEEYVNASQTTLDMAERLEALDMANKTIVEDNGVYPIMHSNNVYAYAEDLQNVEMDPGGNFYIKLVTRK
jgi:peptide/nickel transport system substrate-binding protein